jgi:DNA invertase Pin-like site-specific DNA recombinase
MKVALYLRVSTTELKRTEKSWREQTTTNQRLDLERVATERGYEIIEIYEDAGISGAKGRDQRPAFDRLHKDATRRKFDLIMAWSVDRLGRSLQDLVAFLNHINATGVGLYLHQQGLDTTTPSGKAMFQMLGVFAEFERTVIRDRTIAGMERARIKGTKSGKPIGRPFAVDPLTSRKIRDTYAKGGIGLRPLAKQFGVSVMTVRGCIVKERAAQSQGV